MEPLIIEDVPSLINEVTINNQYPSNTKITIIENFETPTKTPDETQGEMVIETQPTQLIREPPYPEWLTLEKTVEQP